MQTRASQALGTRPGALWESEAAQCILCGERRRDYLFVAGSARVTRCHGCGLISRTGSGGSAGASYRLDADSAASLAQALPPGRILLVSDDSGALAPGPGRETVIVADAAVSQGLESRSFDAALINGALDFAVDPLALLRQVAGAVKAGGPLIAIAGAADVSRLPADALPAHSFTPATLLLLAQVAGLRTESCGLLRRSIDTPAPDPRLAQVPPVPLLARAIARVLRRPIEVSSGVFEMRARVAEARQRPKLSIIMPVYNEAATFLDTFHRVQGAKLEGMDRELIVVESNSTDGSRELVRSVERLPGVRAVYQDAPSGKGHAVRAGMAVADGDVLLIQDADSEYDVGDYDIVLEPLLRLSSTFVLGSRHMGGRTWKIRQFADARTVAGIMNLGHQLFTSLANWLYGAEMRDPTTMYKVFRREAVAGLRFRRNRFDFDWELVCKLIRRGHLPAEVPINYRSRSYAEGKKVRFFRDPITWLRTIIASRFEPLA